MITHSLSTEGYGLRGFRLYKEDSLSVEVMVTTESGLSGEKVNMRHKNTCMYTDNIVSGNHKKDKMNHKIVYK
jgi:hypothetical protein